MTKPPKPRGMTFWPTDVPAEEAPYVVRIDWDTFDDRWEPKAIRVATRLPDETGPITGAVLRSLPIASIVATVRSGQKDLAEQTGERLKADEVEIPEGYLEAWETGKRPRLGRDHYEDVAAIYRAAYQAGQYPTKAVAEKFSVSSSTAGSWVSRARNLYDLLPDTPAGKAGI